MKIKEEQQRDHALYFVEGGEAGFNPDHNKMVIERTIKKYNAMRLKRRKAYQEALAERSDAVVTYLRAVDRGKEANVDKYFGKKMLAYLRGEKIVSRLKQNSILGKPSRELYIPGN